MILNFIVIKMMWQKQHHVLSKPILFSFLSNSVSQTPLFFVCCVIEFLLIKCGWEVIQAISRPNPCYILCCPPCPLLFLICKLDANTRYFQELPVNVSHSLPEMLHQADILSLPTPVSNCDQMKTKFNSGIVCNLALIT